MVKDVLGGCSLQVKSQDVAVDRQLDFPGWVEGWL